MEANDTAKNLMSASGTAIFMPIATRAATNAPTAPPIHQRNQQQAEPGPRFEPTAAACLAISG
ncbi:hypothetical protein HDG38_006921 [Paraburkholderia sp. WSM4177]|nr:hypothetical protein [Paraburkholderia sp. WSM4177]MBB5488655.1 hypothetical protein [Paraburkholderia sp. WSM4180]